MIDNVNEHDLQQRLRSDDKSALALVYKSYKSEFLNFSKRYNLDSDQALDIYQDSIIALYQNFTMQQLELSDSSVKTYLFGIGKHKIYKLANTNTRKIPLQIEVESSEHISIEYEAPNFYQKQLSKLIEQMSDSCKELLRFYYYRNLTINEIVERSQYKDANTVKSHKSRCMKRLKSLVKA